VRTKILSLSNREGGMKPVLQFGTYLEGRLANTTMAALPATMTVKTTMTVKIGVSTGIEPSFHPGERGGVVTASQPADRFNECWPPPRSSGWSQVHNQNAFNSMAAPAPLVGAERRF